MGGASKKLNHAMTAERPERSDISFVQARVDEVPRPTESGVFVTSPRTIDVKALWDQIDPRVDKHAIEEVTLIVYGWENVQPGTLSWVFPSLRSALAAVRAMRNAVRWAVLDGIVSHDESARDVDSARENGLVLVEAN